MSRRKEEGARKACTYCRKIYPIAEFYDEGGNYHPRCSTCQDILEQPLRKCAGWTDPSGKHHECNRRIVDYRCPDCWKNQRGIPDEVAFDATEEYSFRF
jgi:hypothetical protein